MGANSRPITCTSPGSTTSTGIPSSSPEPWRASQQRDVFVLEDGGGQFAGCVGARVEIDPVLAKIRPRHGRVAMHDHLAEIVGRAEEFVADPDEVMVGL